MKRHLLKLTALMALATTLFPAMRSLPAYAAENVEKVVIHAMPEDEVLEPGKIYAGGEPYIEDGSASVIDYSTSTSNYKSGSSYTYTIKLEAIDGTSFTKDTVVQVYGAYEVSISSRTASAMTVKAKAYPFEMLDDPDGFNEDGDKITWDKVENAGKYNVFVYYTDKNGNEKTKKKTTTGASFDISAYDDYDDLAVSVQAVPKSNNKGGKYVMNSRAVFTDGGVDEEQTDEESVKRFSASSNGTSSGDNSSSSKKGSTGTVSGGPGAASNPQPAVSSGQNGWVGSGDDWHWYENGQMVTNRWVDDGGNWYFMDANGNMKYGWLEDGGQTYYLNEQHDGTFGRMLAGWQQVGESWYYLHTEHDGTYGRLWRNATTPDGYTVNESGVWIQ